MGKRKQAASANSIEAPSAISKRTRQESKRSDSQKREDESKSEAPSLSQTNSTSSKIEEASTTGEVITQTTTLATTAAATKTTTTTTVAVSKPLPRIVVPAGLVPRQIARPKGVITATKTNATTNHESLKSSTTGSSPSLSTKSSSRNGSISTTTSTTTTTGADVSTSISTQPSRTTVFRAKDIIQHWLPPLPDSLPSTRRSVARVSSSVSTSATMDASDQPTMNTMIRADPIIVYREKYPNRREYPYGNYPSYYETRIDEQTKDVKSDAPVSKSTTSTPPISTSTLKTTPRANPLSLFKGKSSLTDLPFQTQPRGKSHRIWKRTLSVLFPPPDSSAADSDGAAVNGETSHPAMTLNELAKKVDIRFEFLDPSWFRGKKVLDIGCNSALLTIFIAVHYKPCKIQGVDIDPSLIGRAQSFILKTFSQISSQAYKQQTRHREDTQDTMTTTTTTTGDDDVPYEEYFPRALHKIHGFLPVPPRRPETEKLFPHNIELRVADWATETGNQQEAEGEQWDVILAFSLTKWIHLHGGDAGLKAFFQKIYRSLSPGGILLLEPQAIETYNKRSKILPEMAANYKSIQFKPDQFQAYLLSPEVGFKEVVHLGHSEGSAKNFNRDIFLYRK